MPLINNCTDLIEVQVKDEIVVVVAKHLSGRSGPSGIDSSSLSQ